MLNYLVDALVEAREQAGVSLEDVAFAGREASKARGNEVRIDRSWLSRFERGLAGWTPKIDDVVRAYAKACGVTDTGLWEEALRGYGREEADRVFAVALKKGRAQA